MFSPRYFRKHDENTEILPVSQFILTRIVADKGLVDRPYRSKERSLRLCPSAPTSFGIMTSIAAVGNRKTKETHSFQYLQGQFWTQGLISIAISGFRNLHF